MQISDPDGLDADAALWESVRLLAVEPHQLTTEQYTSVLAFTRRVVGRYVPPEELDDLVGEVMLRWLAAVRAGRIDLLDRPAGYLVTIARNAAIDSLRSNRRRTLADAASLSPDLEELASHAVSEDDVAMIVEHRATAASVRHALSACRRSGDTTAYRVAIHLLDHAERTGSLPSARETGAALGLSHTGVAKALKRLRPYLEGELGLGQ